MGGEMDGERGEDNARLKDLCVSSPFLLSCCCLLLNVLSRQE